MENSEYALHHEDTCVCENGVIGKDKRRLANMKRSEFYKTPKGIEIKKQYKEKSQKGEKSACLAKIGGVF